jgi:hypothetical protein
MRLSPDLVRTNYYVGNHRTASKPHAIWNKTLLQPVQKVLSPAFDSIIESPIDDLFDICKEIEPTLDQLISLVKSTAFQQCIAFLEARLMRV